MAKNIANYKATKDLPDIQITDESIQGLSHMIEGEPLLQKSYCYKARYVYDETTKKIIGNYEITNEIGFDIASKQVSYETKEFCDEIYKELSMLSYDDLEAENENKVNWSPYLKRLDKEIVQELQIDQLLVRSEEELNDTEGKFFALTYRLSGHGFISIESSEGNQTGILSTVENIVFEYDEDSNQVVTVQNCIKPINWERLNGNATLAFYINDGTSKLIIPLNRYGAKENSTENGLYSYTLRYESHTIIYEKCAHEFKKINNTDVSTYVNEMANFLTEHKIVKANPFLDMLDLL